MPIYFIVRKVGDKWAVVLMSTNIRERVDFLAHADKHFHITGKKVAGHQLAIYDGELAMECQPYIEKLNALEMANVFECVKKFVRRGAHENFV